MAPAVSVLNTRNEKVGEVELSEAIFGAKVHGSVLHQMVVMQQASRRRGTASTKGRSEVRGGGRKPWRQKGTGRARAGTIRSPLWRHGGTVFGPKPRDYGFDMPKAMKRTAMRSALSAKAQAGTLRVLDALTFEKPSTKAMATVLKGLEARGRTLLVLPGRDEAVERSARNLPELQVLPARGLNVSDILRAETLVLTRQALAAVEEALAP